MWVPTPNTNSTVKMQLSLLFLSRASIKKKKKSVRSVVSLYVVESKDTTESEFIE